MTILKPGRFVLQAHIGLIRAGVLTCLFATLAALGAGIWTWAASQIKIYNNQEDTEILPTRIPQPSLDTGALVESAAEQNLRDFQLTLGDPAQAEQHVRILFNIAAKLGLELDQGEYKWEFDRSSGSYRYQILLPVKGEYGLIRSFCEKALLALPFASLDELRFRRESIGDDALEGSIRLSLYLAAQLAAPGGTSQ